MYFNIRSKSPERESLARNECDHEIQRSWFIQKTQLERENTMISFYRILATTRLTVEPGDFREIGERHDDCHSQISLNPKFGQIWLTSTKSGGTPLIGQHM